MSNATYLTPEQTEARLRELSIKYHQGRPEVTDVEFDALWRSHQRNRAKHADLEVFKDTILDQVGYNPCDPNDVPLPSPMLSLSNIFEQDKASPVEAFVELTDWLRGTGTPVRVEPKIDGMSLNIVFIRGMSSHVLTRGDGTRGTDVTAQFNSMMVQRLGSLSDTFPGDLEILGRGVRALAPDSIVEIRGELCVTNFAFQKMNAERKAAMLSEYSNPRNCVPGLIMGKDPENEPFLKYLSFIPHGAVVDGMVCDDQDFLTLTAGLACAPGVYVAPEQLNDMAYWRRVIDHLRSFAPYPIDGAVIKHVDRRAERGSTSNAPRWAVALKFVQEKKITKIEEIVVQVSRTGVLAPVAIVAPVTLDGVTVTRVTLHNEEQIQQKNLYVGCDVMVQRAGGVIPEIVAAVNPDPSVKFDLAAHIGNKCPVCGGPIEKQDSAWVCISEACPAKAARRLLHLAGKEAFDIDAMGGEIAEAVSRTLGGDETKIFSLTLGVLSALEISNESGTTTVGESRAARIMSSLQAAMNLPLDRWLVAAGIAKCGRTASAEIARLCRNIDEALHPEGVIASRRTDTKSFAEMKINSALGKVACGAFFDFFATERGRKWYYLLRDFNVQSASYAPVPAGRGKLEGKTFVITGTLSKDRKHFEELIKAAGGKVGSGVSKKTDYLLCGESAGSKLKEAQKHGVPVLSESELAALL